MAEPRTTDQQKPAFQGNGCEHRAGQSDLKSINFEFLRPHWNELASLAGFAETYAHTDAVSALVKLRTFGEQLVQWVYGRLRLPHLPRANLNDLLQSEPFQVAVPRVVVSKLHALRIHGNHAAHGDKVTTKSALWLLKEAHDLSKWLALIGVGISQVVPVVAIALEGSGNLIAIEQPELHLHPRLQAELGDLFIESALGDRKHQVLLELHSEHLILRLLRRIRETAEGKPHRGLAIDERDIAIYYAKSDEGRTGFIKIDVDKRGDFIQPWPDDFFEIDFYERFGNAR